MTKNPFINAGAAIAYITLVASFMFNVGKFVGNDKDTVLAPIVLLSLFTFSAAAMAYIFFYNPFQMYFDGKKKAAIELALKSFLSFGGITLIVLILLLLRIFH